MNKRIVASLTVLMLTATACSATPTVTTTETVQPVSPGVTTDQFATEDPPAELAFADVATEDEVVITDSTSSDAFCAASANIWIHASALDAVSAEGDVELNQIAMAHVAEWLERASLLDDEAAADRAAMFGNFEELQRVVASNFDDDWMAFQASPNYDQLTAARAYEAGRVALATFVGSDECEGFDMASLLNNAADRVSELTTEFATSASTIVPSASLPGYSVFTHASGRLSASFPTAWQYAYDDATVALVASPDVERFTQGAAIDGVHLQVVEAESIDEFRDIIDATPTGQACTRLIDLQDRGTSRMNITQTFDCRDHAASIIGQYREDQSRGLIVEGSFDTIEASRADLNRLSSIASSALWN